MVELPPIDQKEIERVVDSAIVLKEISFPSFSLTVGDIAAAAYARKIQDVQPAFFPDANSLALMVTMERELVLHAISPSLFPIPSDQKETTKRALIGNYTHFGIAKGKVTAEQHVEALTNVAQRIAEKYFPELAGHAKG